MENKNKKKNNYWAKLEKSIGSKFPEPIINILEKCGFDCEIALSEIDADCIDLIEKHLNKNRDLVKSTVYENQDEVKILPGHRQIIASIPEHIKKFKTNQTKKPTSVKRIQQSQQPKISFPSVQSETGETIDAELVTLNEETEKCLLDGILSKLKNTAKNIKLAININEECIQDLRYICDKNFRCTFVCPLCSKKYSCIYKSHWKASNAQAHLKSHKDEDIDEDIDQILERANSSINK